MQIEIRRTHLVLLAVLFVCCLTLQTLLQLIIFRSEFVTGTSSSPNRYHHRMSANGNAMGGHSEHSPYEVVERGSLFSLDYRLYFKGPDGFVSPWHDIPLFANESAKVYNMIVEIPRWSNAKMEMATKEPLTPIRQDEKNGKPRFVHNVFPHHGYIWNYGALPQTWEDPGHIVEETDAKGDNDPIDVVEIGSKIQGRGAVVQVKILGTLALIDEGETDWKLVAIDINDPLADKLNAIGDVEQYFPGLLKATHEWFRTYKIPAGKPANKFGFNGQYKDRDYAQKIIAETHDHWKQLMADENPPLNTQSRTNEGSFKVSADEAKSLMEKSAKLSTAHSEPAELDRWHFISE